MTNAITILLKFANGDTCEKEVSLTEIQDIGVIFDKLTEKFFVFAKLDGRFFNLPVFEECKMLALGPQELSPPQPCDKFVKALTRIRDYTDVAFDENTVRAMTQIAEEALQ
jgi:hypothetical protein